MRPPNRERGEVEIVLAGKPRLACLTLGGLASLEAVLGARGPAALVRAITAARPDQLRTCVAALHLMPGPVPERASAEEMRAGLIAVFLAGSRP